MRTTEKPTVVIVGGGVAGLAAGCYAQMNGYQSVILEQEPHAGGVCLSWRRRGFTINGCIHWLVGSAPGIGLHDLWQELGALENRAFYHHDRLFTFEATDGQQLVFWSNLDRLRAELLHLAPQDADAIEELIALAQTFASHDLPTGKPQELYTLWDGVKMLWNELPLLRAYVKGSHITLAEFAERFQHPLLRQALSEFWGRNMGLHFLAATMGWVHRQTAGYPLGGSSAFVASIEERYRALGGSIRYNSRVTEFLINEKADRVTGVRVASRTQPDDPTHDIQAHAVLCCADGHSAIFDLLPHHVSNEQLVELRATYDTESLFSPIVFVAFGLRQPEELGIRSGVSGYRFALPQPISVGGVPNHSVNLQLYTYDPTLAPAGQGLATVMLDTDYDFWKAVAPNEAGYRVAKSQVLNDLLAALEQRFPGFGARVLMTDVATPLTYENHTSNWRGAYEGWLPSPKALQKRLPQHFKDLKGFYMAGHWVMPGGGLPAAALTARHAVMLLCHDDHQAFTTTTFPPLH